MSTKQFRDWGSWRDGLRTSIMKAGATSIVTNLAVLVSSNTVNSFGIPGMSNSGESLKTFCIGLIGQFLLHVIYAAALYVQNNPDAQLVTTQVDTTFTSKNPTTGSEVAQSSSTITTTPVVEKVPDK